MIILFIIYVIVTLINLSYLIALKCGKDLPYKCSHIDLKYGLNIYIVVAIIPIFNNFLLLDILWCLAEDKANG